MNSVWLNYLNYLDILIYNAVTGLSSFIFPTFKAIFMNCPFYYQLVYGYSLVAMYFIFKKNKHNDKYFNNEVILWFSLIMLKVFKLIKNPKIIFNLIISFFKKIMYSYITIISYIALFDLSLFFKEIKKKNTYHFWRPIYKKYSYMGVNSFLRSKWYKKK